MFDSHCHLDDGAYDSDRTLVLERAKAVGIEGILVPGYEPQEWARLADFCAVDRMLSWGVGLHPWYVHTLDSAQLSQALDALAAYAHVPGVAAIGECGLDGLKARRGGAPLDLQLRVLTRHLKLAREHALPLILHCVHAHGALLALLESQGPLSRGGVMHSYSGPRELIPRYARLGLYFSFAGIITRKNAKRPREALRHVPLERLLVESDGPDQLAEGVAGNRSEPAHIVHVLAAAAELRTEPLEVLKRACRENARKLFSR